MDYGQSEDYDLRVQLHMIGQAVILRVAAVLAEYLLQRGTSLTRKDVYKKLKHWATAFSST